jgi:hypothetical protein
MKAAVVELRPPLFRFGRIRERFWRDGSVRPPRARSRRGLFFPGAEEAIEVLFFDREAAGWERHEGHSRGAEGLADGVGAAHAGPTCGGGHFDQSHGEGWTGKKLRDVNLSGLICI